MSFHLFDAPATEPSQIMGFAGNILDRQSENRSDDAALRALADPAARLFLMGGGRALLQLAGEAFESQFTRAEAQAFQALEDQAILLGFSAQGPLLAAPVSLDPEALPDTIKAIDYRSINMQGLLDPASLGALAQGAGLLAWHANHRFCGRCGQPTEMRAGGYKRLCVACGTEHFPRTDPVAIMLTVARDKCILGRSKHFAPGMYSALAGFIEPGETIENAVRRETLEEAGIRLGRVVYHASQPWPFPYSLMIGCYGEALSEEIDADLEELEDCRWFSREEVLTMLDRTHPTRFVPPKGAIAYHLIRDWAVSA